MSLEHPSLWDWFIWKGPECTHSRGDAILGSPSSVGLCISKRLGSLCHWWSVFRRQWHKSEPRNGTQLSWHPSSGRELNSIITALALHVTEDLITASWIHFFIAKTHFLFTVHQITNNFKIKLLWFESKVFSKRLYTDGLYTVHSPWCYLGRF